MKGKGKFVSHDEGLRNDLKNQKFAVEYLRAAIEESGADAPELVLLALRRIAEVHGMGWLSKRTAIGRQALYQMLSKDGNPSIRNFLAIVRNLGIRLSFESEKDGNLPVRKVASGR